MSEGMMEMEGEKIFHFRGLEGVWYNSVRHELMVATATKNIVFLDAETLTVKREIVGMHDEVRYYYLFPLKYWEIGCAMGDDD